MKRWALVPVLAGLSILATACPEPPPTGWTPPEVQSIVVAPAEVVAGTDFTVTATATDDKIVQGVSFLLYTGAPGVLATPRWLACEQAPFVPAQTVVVELRCEMPDYAPNGSWNVAVGAVDGEYSPPPPASAGSKVQNFTVTGGANDYQAPVVGPLVLDPSPPVAGIPFTITIDVSDDRLRGDDGGTYATPSTQTNPTFCPQQSKTPTSATSLRYVYACPGLVAGTYLVTHPYFDLAGNSASVRDYVIVATA